MSLFLYEERVLILPAKDAGKAPRLINYLETQLGWEIKSQSPDPDGNIRLVFWMATGVGA